MYALHNNNYGKVHEYLTNCTKNNTNIILFKCNLIIHYVCIFMEQMLHSYPHLNLLAIHIYTIASYVVRH